MLSNKNNNAIINTLTIAFLMLSITIGTKQLIKMYRENNCSCKQKKDEGK